ncbi:hypothetical protein PR202_ga15912 [Eleusine coracana subsp. coracana]|uniref:Uncharacterized protein n=1 Tax=Eleusine coracana subsp. coracana TaxID=191504 RepID=A0AAV5CKV6_ELECO|nr:hypothetical protein PR202_ga15912 [Eleusine coracana subsp. coracana]
MEATPKSQPKNGPIHLSVLNFAGEHSITVDVEVVGMDYVNTAIERLERNDVRYRFVVDVAAAAEPGSRCLRMQYT